MTKIDIRVSIEFLDKLKYLQRINAYKSKSETIRKIIEKEYRKEREDGRYKDI